MEISRFQCEAGYGLSDPQHCHEAAIRVSQRIECGEVDPGARLGDSQACTPQVHSDPGHDATEILRPAVEDLLASDLGSEAAGVWMVRPRRMAAGES